MRAVCITEALACRRASSVSINCKLFNCPLALSDRLSNSYGLLSMVIVVMDTLSLKKKECSDFKC